MTLMRGGARLLWSLNILETKLGDDLRLSLPISFYPLRCSCPWTSEFALRNWRTWTQIWSLARDKASSFIAPWVFYPPERRKSMHRDFFKNCKILPCLQLYHQHHSWLSDWKVKKKIHLKDWVESKEVRVQCWERRQSDEGFQFEYCLTDVHIWQLERRQ